MNHKNKRAKSKMKWIKTNKIYTCISEQIFKEWDIKKRVTQYQLRMPHERKHYKKPNEN